MGDDASGGEPVPGEGMVESPKRKADSLADEDEDVKPPVKKAAPARSAASVDQGSSVPTPDKGKGRATVLRNAEAGPSTPPKPVIGSQPGQTSSLDPSVSPPAAPRVRYIRR